MPTYEELLMAAKIVVREVDCDGANEALATGKVTFIDVREQFETDLGIIEGARIIRLAELRDQIASEVPDTSTPIVLYCEHGNRSAVAALFLMDMGYNDVASLAGGTVVWQQAGLPLVKAEE